MGMIKYASVVLMRVGDVGILVRSCPRHAQETCCRTARCTATIGPGNQNPNTLWRDYWSDKIAVTTVLLSAMIEIQLPSESSPLSSSLSKGNVDMTPVLVINEVDRIDTSQQ
jgi:hypothetical protein